MKERIDFIREHWKLISWLIFIVVQIILLPVGMVLFVIGGINLHITIHAVVMFTYKTWQKTLAYKYLKYVFEKYRQPYIESAVENHPELEKEIRKLEKKYVGYDTFRHRIKKLGVSEEDWVNVINGAYKKHQPRTSICVPIYDIEHEILKMQVDSMVAQTYRAIHKIYLGVNDENDQETVDYLKSYTSTLETDIVFDVFIEPTAGKRHVQKAMFDKAVVDGCEIVTHMDGDGFADPDAVANLMMPFTQDAKIGLVTGDVRVMNMGYNMQTTVIGIRYHNAFYDDRAAFMNCPSGPNFAIRVDVLLLILLIWFFDSFMKVRMTFGDDRCMGYVIQMLSMIAKDPERVIKRLKDRKDELGLREEDLDNILAYFIQNPEMQDKYAGTKIVFAPDSVVYTDAPTERKEYKHQQIRWNKSALIYNYKLYRSGIWEEELGWFAKNSLVYLTFYPVVVMAAMITIFLVSLWFLFVQGDPWMAVRISGVYLLSVVIIHWLFFSITGLWLRRDWRFIFSPLHFPLWMEVQMPAKGIAFTSLDDRKWGTRAKRIEGEVDVDEHP